MANLFGKLWRAFLDVPELATPPDFEGEEQYLHFAEWKMTPESTNVWGFQYNDQARTLKVGYVGWKNQRDESKLRFYKYFDLDEMEALQFFYASSAGGKVWDDLRKRGTVCGHKKSYIFLPNESAYHPKDPCW